MAVMGQCGYLVGRKVVEKKDCVAGIGVEGRGKGEFPSQGCHRGGRSIKIRFRSEREIGIRIEYMKSRHVSKLLSTTIVEQSFLLQRIGEIKLMLHIFLRSDQRGFGELLVETGDLDLLAVFRHLFKVVGRSELLKLLGEFLLYILRNLVGSFSNHANRLIDVSGLLGKADKIAGDRVKRCVCLLVIHIFI